MAARPANSAKGGQILVSSSVREKSKSQDNFEFVDTDYRKLKGIGNEEVSELLLKVTLISTCQWSWIGGWQKKIGLEHSIQEAQLDLKGNRIVISLKGEGVLTLTEDEVDLSAAKDFAAKFRKIKSS